MAGKDDEIVVNVDDEETIAVNIEDDPSLAGTDPKTPKEEVAAAKTPKEPKVAKRVVPQEQAAVPQPAHEEALAQAQTYAKQQEEARRAADATAANERAMREQAQREAQQARKAAEEAAERANNSELANIENGIAAAQKELEAHEAEYTRAAEAGEFAKMASIQTKLSKAAAALDRLEASKTAYDARPATTTEGRVVEQPAATNPVEQYLAGFAPVAQNWLRQHMDCIDPRVGGNAAKNSMMMAGHYAAKAKNIAEGTPEYFKVLEEHIGGQQEATIPAVVPGVTSRAAEVQAAVVEPKTSKSAPVAAPVSRDAPSAAGAPRSVREVRLTKDQQEMARVSFPHLPENQAYGMYARNLIELEAEGKIGRLTH
jgi:hypothetical protein